MEVEEPTVTVSKNTLKKVLDGLNTLRQHVTTLLQEQTKQEKSSRFSLYYGVLLGGLIGVIGNFFVQLFFVEVTSWTWIGLAISGLLFLLVCALLALEAKKYARAREEYNRYPNCGTHTQTLSLELLQAYLKEWGLCQDNLKRHNDWVWQVGAIFIALSLGAMWATTQIEVEQNKNAIWVLASFSMVIMLFWGWVILRARFYGRWTHERLNQIENKLMKAPNLEYEKNEELLHTFIKRKDRGFRPPPVKWFAPILIAMVFVAWVFLLLHYGCIIVAL